MIRSLKQDRTIQVTKPYSPHPPGPKQRAFLNLDVEEAFYGGAAGGGKTDALLLAALQYVDRPGYSAGIFRRSLKDLALPSAAKARADEWFRGTNARWDGEMGAWRFPTLPGAPDATLYFGYLTNDADKVRYQGAEFQFIGIDEVTQWQEAHYRYLFSRLRKLKGVDLPLRMRSTANPGGVGHAWVKRRFVAYSRANDGSDYPEFLRRRRARLPLPDPPYFVSPPSDEAVELGKIQKRRPVGAYFVPAFAEDNPGLDVESYRQSLAQLDPTERAQLEEGDWDAVPSGKFFKEAWFKFIDKPPTGVRFIRYWDLAGTKPRPGRDPDWSAGAKVGVRLNQAKAYEAIISDVSRFREDPGETELNVRAVADLDSRKVPIYMEEEPGSSGKNNTNNYATRVLFGFQVHGHRKTGPKPEYWKGLSSCARNQGLYLVRGAWNESFVRELCSIPVGHDDQADAASGGFAMLTTDLDLANFRAVVGG